MSDLRFVKSYGSENDSEYNLSVVRNGESVNFAVKTYNLFNKNYKVGENWEQEWDKILSIVYEYFQSLTDKELDIIFNFYKRSRKNINAIDENNYEEIADMIYDDINNIVNNEFNIVKSCVDFIYNNQNLNYPNLDNIGKEAHHKKENTFYLEDYKLLTGISLFCKMFIPIFGNYIEFTKNYISKVFKEDKAAQIILPLFNREETYNIIINYFNIQNRL